MHSGRVAGVMTTNEPRATTWKRRAVTIPSVLAMTVVAALGFPLLAPLAIFADLVRMRLRLPTIRVYLFVLQYLLNDSVEIVAAPLLWMAAGFGTRLRSPRSIERHDRLASWSVQLLRHRAEQLLGLKVEMSADTRAAAFGPGPVIVLSRHISLFDASLPGILYQDEDFKVTGVIMAELLADPGFDLIYGRTGSVFIARDDGLKAVQSIRAMTRNSDERSAAVIFPEGRLFRPAVRDRLLVRLAEKDPERAAHLSGLTSLLPPRPGGVLAMLDAMPHADVVLLNHTGLDSLGRMADLLHRAPLTQPIVIDAERIPRCTIPTDPASQTRWLDQLWLDLDRRLQNPPG